jgi:hypothetical protein
MTSVRASWLVAALLTFPCMGCLADPPKPTEVGSAKKAEPVEPAEPAKPVDPKALTAEELALLDADPKTLTPEQNKKRGYALRKKIMQNPDSEAAKALEDARKAVESGELVIPPSGEPAKPADNGVVIPAPDFLKNQDQSYGKPAE